MSESLFRLSQEKDSPGKDSDCKLSAGALGEKFACQILQVKGYKILRKNWRCRAGEIDIICRDGRDLVFVEVKTRRSGKLAERNLFENVDARKSRKLQVLCDLWLCRFRIGQRIPPHRIDLVGIVLDRDSLELLTYRHIKSAI